METEIGSNNSSSNSSSSSNSNGNKVKAPLVVLKTLNTVTLKPLRECSPQSLAALSSLQESKQDITHNKQPPQLCANNQHKTATQFAQFKGQSYVENKASCSDVAFKALRPKWTGLERSFTVGNVPITGMKSLTLERSRDIHLSQQSITAMEGASKTLVRSRPKVPTGLTTHSRRHSEDNSCASVEDLACALTALKSTDWRKYSRKGRTGTSPCESVTSTLSPECHTPQSEGSTPKVGRTPSFKTVRTRLEKMATENSDTSGNTFCQQVLFPFNKVQIDTNEKLKNIEEKDTDNSENSPPLKQSSINALGFSASLLDDIDDKSDNKCSSQLNDDLLTNPDCSDIEPICQTNTQDNIQSTSKNSGDKFQAVNTNTNSQKSKTVIQKQCGKLFEENYTNYPITESVSSDAILPFKSNKLKNSESEVLISQSIPMVKVQYPQGSVLFKSHVQGGDSTDADSVSLASSKLKALSSFDSVRDSEEDLHVTEDDSSSPALRKRDPVDNNNSQTEDEGLGAIDIEGSSYNDVYQSVTSNVKSTSHENKQLVSSIASSIKNMPPQMTDVQTGDNKEEPRNANGRFRTHPPIKERLSSETGSLDSNGLGSLRESGTTHPTELESQISSASSFDSHLCPSELSTDQQVTDSDVTPVPDDLHSLDSGDNTLTKHKSPFAGTKTVDLKKSTVINPKNESKDPKQKLLNFHRKVQTITLSPLASEPSTDHQSKVRSRSRSPRPDVKLSDDSSSGNEGQINIPVKRPSKKRQRGGSSDRWEQKERIAEKIPKTVKPSVTSVVSSSTSASPQSSKSRFKFRTLPASLPSTPLTSPESTLTRNKSTLTPDILTRKLPTLLRSHSSASVLMHNARPKLGESLRSPGADNRSSTLGNRSDKSPGQFSPSLEPIYSSSLSLFEGPDNEKKKRDLIVQEFYSTEKQYVEALQVLVERYLIPLKTQRILYSTVVDEIFYKVNEIYMHHATLLAFMDRSLSNWDDETTIGDVIYKTFCKQTVVESYVSFIENFPRAEKALDDVSSKSAFQKFLEQVEREGRIKLPLKAQIVKPAQRIPRYELLIKRLQEHTPADHPDTKFLKQAEEALHQVALRINSVKQSKKEEDLQGTLKQLELLLLTDLASPDRQYQRHDMVQILNRKDQCCMWLFSDLIVISTIKRKSGPVSRKSSLLLQSSAGHDFIENTKQRLWLKLSLEDVEIVQGDPSRPEKKPVMDKDDLEEDHKLLTDISELSHRLKCDHDTLDESLRELVAQVNKQLSEYQLKPPPPEANKLQLAATITNGTVMNLTVVFQSPDKKISWIALFFETKQKLSKVRDAKPPEFLQALQITKTRAGMQELSYMSSMQFLLVKDTKLGINKFSCAAPIDGVNPRGFRDVWVCNSDGYVGHMCLLTLMPEPIVTLNSPVPGCNSRILCICAVPPFQKYLSRHGSGHRRPGVTQAPSIKIQQDSTDFSGEDGYVSDSSTSSTDTDVEMTDDSVPLNIVNRTDSDRSDRTRSSRSPSPCQSLPSSNSGIISPKEQHPLLNPYKSSMWMGTEDGCIHIFPSTDNIKTSKNKIKLQHSAAVLCIIHMETTVFVSLANGDLVVYKRDPEGHWETSEFETISLTSATSPVNKMLQVAGKLWCASNNDIIVVNPNTLEPELTFTGNPDSKRGIHTMVCSGLGVWVAGNGSSKVFLYHATHYELLLDISIAQAVAQKLQSADDIIRQHKTACLRITTLLACKDSLWVGTSAGVILTVPMPKVSAMTTKSSVASPPVTGLVYGHTGHVRFLTCVEMPMLHVKPSTQHSTPKQKTQINVHQHRKSSISVRPLSSCFLVISGGDGYEDFGGSNGNNGADATGKDDSINHLLLWQV